jgi:anion-transporting  ArsA/GET3 family ATPase
MIDSSRLVVVCGSGGVGKTTVAAALGVRAAVEEGKRVLVLTVDPARRLADALGLEEIGNVIVEVDLAGHHGPGRLFVGMIDRKASWDELIERVAPNTDVAERVIGNQLYRNLTERFVHSHDYIAMERLYEAYLSNEYDVVVVDTPPSRNALDVLDAPQRMQDFFASKLLKFLTAPGQSRLFSLASRPFFLVADRILGARFLEDITEFFTLFRTMEAGFVERNTQVSGLLRGSETSFVVVTTLESAPLFEAKFLIDELGARSYRLGFVVANRAIDADLVARAAADLARWDGVTAELRDALARSTEHLDIDSGDLDRVVIEAVEMARGMVTRAESEHARLAALVEGAEGVAVLRAPLQSSDVTTFDDLVRLQRGFVQVIVG